MPNALILKVHEDTDIDVSELESIWDNSVKFAQKHGINNPDRYANGVLQHVKENALSNKAQDSKDRRHVDRNKYVIAPNSIITGADVATYRGREIPKWRLLGLDPDKSYEVYRPIEEIRDNDFNGKPVLSEHIGDFSADTAHNYADYVMGAAHDTDKAGSEIKGGITLWNREGINDLDRGKKYLSAGYWYDAVIEAGQFNGKPYDIIMRNIEANHIALVDDPRYEDAIVGDNKPNLIKESVIMKYTSKFKHITNLVNTMLGLGMDSKVVEEAAKVAEGEAESELKEGTKGTDGDNPPSGGIKPTENKVPEPKKGEDGKDPEDDKATDGDTFTRAEVAEIVKAEIAKASKNTKKEIAEDAKALDSARRNFRLMYGEPSMALDSAVEINKAILKNANITCDGKTDEFISGAVETLISSKASTRYGKTGGSVTHMAMDSNNSDLNLLPKHLADNLKGSK